MKFSIAVFSALTLGGCATQEQAVSDPPEERYVREIYPDATILGSSRTNVNERSGRYSVDVRIRPSVEFGLERVLRLECSTSGCVEITGDRR